MLHAITSAFPTAEETGSIMGPPISPKKLEEEGAWETRKEILGWVLDGIQKTIQLPPDKCDKLLNLLTEISRKSVATVKELQSMQGKLQFASIGIPLGKPLLGPIDRIIAKAEKNKRTKVKIKDEIVTYTQNWKALIHLMRTRPSHVRELTMNKEAAYRGLVDASKWGVRGVWFSGTKKLRPFVWFQK